MARNIQRAAGNTTEVSANISGVRTAAEETGRASVHTLEAANGLSTLAARLEEELRRVLR
jgi:methyl-accepting chemotaxis protein